MDPALPALTLVPVGVPGIEAVPAGSERLVVDEATDRVHLLNPTATLVWSFADGHSSLADFAADLADELDLGVDSMAIEIRELAADLLERGLWHDARSGPPQPPPTTPSAVRHLVGRPNPGLERRVAPATSVVISVRRDGVTFDLRVDDAGLADHLVAGLCDARIDAWIDARVGDPAERPQLPLHWVLAGRRSGSTTRFHQLRRGDRPVRRTRRRNDLVRIVVAEVGAVLDRECDGRPLLDAVGLHRHGRWVLIDPTFSPVIDDLERRLADSGIGRADASMVDLDPRGPEQIAALVLRPGPEPVLDERADPLDRREAQAARTVLAASDLARGPAHRLSTASVGRLLDIARTAPVIRVTGRDQLRHVVSAHLT